MVTSTLLGDFPNTYTYTKCIAEQVVRQYGKDLPIGIHRPAIGNFKKLIYSKNCFNYTLLSYCGWIVNQLIEYPTTIILQYIFLHYFSVISTYKEPVSGWIDNIFGVTGALVGGGAGLLRVMNFDKNYTAQIVPADLTVNSLIASAWDVANNK